MNMQCDRCGAAKDPHKWCKECGHESPAATQYKNDLNEALACLFRHHGHPLIPPGQICKICRPDISIKNIPCPGCGQQKPGWPDEWRNMPEPQNPKGTRYVCKDCAKT